MFTFSRISKASAFAHVVKTAIGFFALALLTVGFGLHAPKAAAASKIAIVVNNTPITTNQIRRRAAFVKLRRQKGNRTQIARKELVEDALKMQEAKRLRQTATDKEVNEAYVRFAKRNKMPVKALTQIMNRSGVSSRGFKEFIRVQISWQRVMGLRLRRQGSQQAASARSPLAHLHGKNALGKREETTEYNLQQIVFVVPRKRFKAEQPRRVKEANQFRSRFPGCEGSRGLARQIKDVAVIDQGRVQLQELPPRWRKEIESTDVGKTTRPIKTEKGVELMAVCKTRKARAKTALNGSGGLFSGGAPSNAEVDKVEKEYLAELRKKAVIKNR